MSVVFLSIKRSKKCTFLSSNVSTVKFRFLWKPLSACKKVGTSDFLIKTSVSSIHRIQNLKHPLLNKSLTNTLSISVIFTFGIKETKGDDIDTSSSICSYNFLLKEKAVLVHASNNTFLSDLSASVLIFFSCILCSRWDDFNSFLLQDVCE